MGQPPISRWGCRLLQAIDSSRPASHSHSFDGPGVSVFRNDQAKTQSWLDPKQFAAGNDPQHHELGQAISL
jgi:hypothetical protein